MAFAPGDIVVNQAAIALCGRKTPPLFGRVESTGPTLVDWEDGTTSTYTADDQLYKVGPPNDPASADPYFWAYCAGLALNPGGRFSGVCVGVFGLTDNAGAFQADYGVFRVAGDLFFMSPLAAFAIVPNR